MSSDRLTHAGAIERAWAAAEQAQLAIDDGRAAEAKIRTGLSIAWSRIAGQLPAYPLGEPEPSRLFGLDAGPEYQHDVGCDWPDDQCTGHAPDADATAVIPAVRDVEPGQGGEALCYCSRTFVEGGHARGPDCA
jgi:hypothetical protein